MVNAETLQPSPSRFTRRSLLRMLCLFLLFLLAALVRLHDLKAPGLLLDREYTSAIFARAFYFMSDDEVEAWRRDIAVTTMNQQPVLEPPLVEYLVSYIYRLMGREDMSYSRYLTSAFWLIGGMFMYWIARRLLSSEAAIFATIYYLFAPEGILISRSFQPDSLMMLLFLASLLMLVRYFESPGVGRLLQGSIITALTLLLRPLVIFAVFFAFLAMSFQKEGNWRKILKPPLIIFSMISLLPAAIYYGYGIVFAGFMRWKISNSFMPHLLTKKDFWLGWLQSGSEVVGGTFLIAAIIGFFLIPNRLARSLVIGLAVSYPIFGLAFTYHIHTHPYYHIQLFPLVAICAAACLDMLIKVLRHHAGKLWLVPVMISLLISFSLVFLTFRHSLYRARMEDPRIAWEIGELIAHSPHTVFIARYYGLPLEYYGEFGGAPWPVRIEDPFYRAPGAAEQSVKERMDRLGFRPEYFVVTHFDLYERKHQDLQEYLKDSCALQIQAPEYLVYGNCLEPAGNRASQ